MKKNYLLTLSLLVLSLLNFAQTNTALKSLGWNGDIGHLTDDYFVVMPSYNQAAIDRQDHIDDLTKDKPWRFGYKYDTDFSLTNSGNWITLDNGDRLWRLGIECESALTINLLLTDFELPKGGKLFLYDAERTNKIGAYTAANNRVERELGTELIHGERIIVEYYEPAAVAGEGSFTISNVIHGYRSLNEVQEKLERSLNDAGDCNIDVNCDLGDGWELQIRSVAMIVVSGNGICTGALINNSCDDGTPYFLTANHCLGGSTASWAFRFNWESPEGTESCATTDPSVNPGPPYDQTANGAVVLASGTIADFALLQIDNLTSEQATDWEVFYAGWDKSDEETVTQATGIHHPRGDLKKICREDESPYHETASGAQVWWIADWDQGVTEPGSSGSPLFDQNGRIIGQLYGGAAACSGTVDNDAYDYYGRFGVSWVNGVSDHLIKDECPSDEATNDGFDPVVSCDGVLAIAKVDATCNGGNNGTIDVTVTGGTAPFTYDIGSGPVASGSFTDLTAGSYTVTVTDNVGCTSSISATIAEPAGIISFWSATNETYGDDGAINLTVTGGTPPYSYDWTGPYGFTATTQDITGLKGGIYNCLITDANGCIEARDEILVKSTVSLTENDLNVGIYPNPSTGVFTLIQQNNHKLTYTVYDLTGRVIIDKKVATTATEIIDLTNKAAGTYLIKLETENSTTIQRLVKK